MRILLVEDDVDMLRLVERVLRRRGHEVTACGDAETAWAACQRESFPLVILDWVLPGMDGLQLCRQIRTLPDGDVLVVLVLTARDTPQDLAAVLDAGADDYLAKPFHSAVLEVRLTIAERQVAEIAARKRAEEALVEARAAAAEAAAWRELNREQELLLRVISHEFRTPLTILSGYSELLLTREARPELLREGLEAIHQAARRLRSLVDDIVELASVEAGHRALTRTPADLAVLLPGWVAEAEHAGRLSLAVAEGLPPVLADIPRLKRAVGQLIDNGLKFTPDGAPVAVRAGPAGSGEVAIRVTDGGGGIPRAEHERLFDPFYRTTVAHEQVIPGLGLGLALARRIAELHGGRIDVQSALGVGSTFTITLPAAPPEAPAAARGDGRAAHGTPPSPRAALPMRDGPGSEWTADTV